MFGELLAISNLFRHQKKRKSHNSHESTQFSRSSTATYSYLQTDFLTRSLEIPTTIYTGYDKLKLHVIVVVVVVIVIVIFIVKRCGGVLGAYLGNGDIVHWRQAVEHLVVLFLHTVPQSIRCAAVARVTLDLHPRHFHDVSTVKPCNL